MTQKTEMPIAITAKAAAAIREKLALKEGAKGLRLNVLSGGCSGYSYEMDHAMEEHPDDDRLEKDGAVLYIPKTQSWMLMGLEIGYEETPLRKGFTFKNPNETGRCGCGSSFSVE